MSASIFGGNGLAEYDKLISLKFAAWRLGIATQTARNWLVQGRFPVPTTKIGRLRMVRKSDVDRFIAASRGW